MEEQKKQGHKGKGQKYKSLLVWDILQKRTDENHAIQLSAAQGAASSRTAGGASENHSKVYG